MGVNVKLKDAESEKLVIAGLLKDTKKVDRVLLDFNAQFFSQPLYKNLFKIISKQIIHNKLS